MIGAAALLLIGLCAESAKPDLLRRASEPRWTVTAATPPIGVAYRRDPGRFVASGARVAIPLTPAASLFMQARKQKPDSATGFIDAATPSQSRAYSVGVSVRW